MRGVEQSVADEREEESSLLKLEWFGIPICVIDTVNERGLSVIEVLENLDGDGTRGAG